MLVGEVFARMGLDSKQYEKGLDRLEGYTQKRALTLGTIFKGAFSFALGIGVIQGFRSLGGAITDFVNTAARTEVLNVAMQSVARSSGYMLAAVEADKRAVMELGIAEQEATQILTRFMQAQLDVADAAKLARVAQDAAVITGYNSSQAAEQMTEAIAKQRPELLSAFGMTRNMNEIYKDYAGTVGKTAAQLSEAEKKQAMLNYILAEGEKIAGTYEASMGAVGKQIGSLPRFWDTLKNALARPLALPAISVIVDGITNALKNAISWAEANKAALQMWGQTAANVAGFVIRSFQGVARVFIDNWGAIRFVATALLTYVAAARTAAFVTTQFGYVSQVLSGSLVKTTGFLGWLTRAVSAYRSMTITATIGTNIFSAALVRARFAAQALLASIPVVGWALLALSVAAGAAVSSWSKYSAKVQEAAQKAHMEKIASQTQDMAESALGAADGQDDLADALGEAGKAAGKNLQSFDEVHQLQEDMASVADGTAPGTLDIPKIGEIGIGAIPDIGDMLAGIEAELPPFGERVRGFFGWLWGGIKDGAVSAWNWITGTLSNIWQGIVNLARPIWEPLAPFFAWLWDGIKAAATAVWNVLGPVLSTIWNAIVSTAQTVWSALGPFFAGLWDGVKTAAEVVWGLIRYALAAVWFSLVEIAKATWSVLGPFFEWLWGAVKTVFMVTWNALKAVMVPLWNGMVAVAKAIWSLIGPFFEVLWAGVKWVFESIWLPLATWLEGVWNGIKAVAESVWAWIQKVITDPITAARQTVETVFGAVRDFVGDAWNATLKAVQSVKDLLYDAIVEPFITARDFVVNLIEEAKDWGRNLISNIIDGIKSKANGLKSALSNAAKTFKNYLGFSSPTEEGPGRDADKWAPNLMQMYAGGITAGIPKVRGAVNAAASELTRLTAMPSVPSIPAATAGIAGSADAIAQSVYRAMMDAARITSASTGNQPQGTQEIVLRIDSATFARLMLPSIIKEGQRQGLDLVVRPQGV